MDLVIARLGDWSMCTEANSKAKLSEDVQMRAKKQHLTAKKSSKKSRQSDGLNKIINLLSRLWGSGESDDDE
jgi:hypothetical protein